MAGIFIPFLQYNQDLTRSMQGLSQVYPSRAVTVKLDSTNISDWMADADNEIINISAQAPTPSSIDYGAIRNKLYELIYPHIIIKDSQINEYAPSISDINFLSHELRNGWLYNDIYVHISPEQGGETIVMQQHGLAGSPERTGFAFDVEKDQYEKYSSSRTNLKFNAVILYYSLYQIDSTSSTADTKPIIIDMPLGIYVPESEVTIKASTPELYGQGTSWSTRICSRIANAETLAIGSSDKSNEYATLTKVLSEFGNIAEVVNNILHRREIINTNGASGVASTDSLTLAPEDIKSYLEEFRRENAVNVPYIKDGHWFVNGRDLGTLASTADWIQAFSDWLTEARPEELELIKGPKGDTGPQGSQGAPVSPGSSDGVEHFVENNNRQTDRVSGARN